MSNQGIGERVLRKEDKRFICGNRHYTDDLSVQAWRGPPLPEVNRRNTNIISIDTATAAVMPGVRKILTGADWAADNRGSIPFGFVP